jgi:hypothetical protein
MKRYFIKWIRDAAKSSYAKGTSCEICGSTEELDFHHFFSVSELVHAWERVNGEVKSDDEALTERDKFIEQHKYELFDATVTLCNAHHMKLHSIYGRNPKLSTALKQQNWVKIQREKYGLV